MTYAIYHNKSAVQLPLLIQHISVELCSKDDQSSQNTEFHILFYVKLL